MTETVVRRAREDDVPWLLEQLRQFADFYGREHSVFPDNDQEARDLLGTIIRDHICFIAQRHDQDGPGYRIGLIGGVISPSFYNKSLVVATELWWWVTPTFRGSSAGARLLLEFEEHARRQKAHKIALSLLEKSIELGMIEPSSLARHGYKAQERTFLKPLTQEIA